MKHRIITDRADTSPIGQGRTEQEAIADLRAKLDDMRPDEDAASIATMRGLLRDLEGMLR